MNQKYKAKSNRLVRLNRGPHQLANDTPLTGTERIRERRKLSAVQAREANRTAAASNVTNTHSTSCLKQLNTVESEINNSMSICKWSTGEQPRLMGCQNDGQRLLREQCWRTSDDYFKETFADNVFGHVCDVCNRLWFDGNLKPVRPKHLPMLRIEFPNCDMKEFTALSAK